MAEGLVTQPSGARLPRRIATPPEAEKRGCFEEGPRSSGAKRTETGWADGVFLLHAGRKDFFDTLNVPFGAVLKSAYASVWVGSISVGLGMGCSL